MASAVLQSVIASIQAQLVSAVGGERFTIDQKVAETARYQFTQNYNRNWLYSKCSSLAGIASFVGFGLSVYKFFDSPISSIGLLGVSFVLNRLWIKTRNREGYALQDALNAESEDETILHLSLGANIYQKVWPCGGAAANLFPLVKGGPRTVIQMFAGSGCTKVVAYLAMLEPNLAKRIKMVTEAILYAADKKTAQLLIDLGGDIKAIDKDDQLLWSCCLRKDLELLSFFVDAGARLDAGITDYKRWQTDFDKRQEQFGGNWYSGNNEGVPSNLNPDFYTPLERLLKPNFGPNGRIDSPFINNPGKVLDAMRVDPTVYQNKSSAEELYHALNQAGVRIRLQQAADLFTQLQSVNSQE